MDIPQPFIEQMHRLLGVQEADALCSALSGTEPVTSVRLNDGFDGGALELSDRVPWSSMGFYLSHRPQFTMDPLLHAGRYYVQEASSMFLEQALRQLIDRPVSMLDLCAAPGGKTTLAAQMLPEGSLLVANEIQRGRAQILAENVVKWGHQGVMVSCNTPKQIGDSGLQFDVMLTDVPCSGEGMFRKEEVAVHDWSPEAVTMCAERQREILRDAWAALKPGGILIYSTCTFNAQEDEENVKWISEELGAVPVCLEIPSEWNISGCYDGYDLPVYHFFPHKTRGEGFFIAVLRKKDGELREQRELKLTDSGQCKDWLSLPNDYVTEVECGNVIARPKNLAAQMKAVSSRLYCLVKGIEVAVQKGRDYVPSHQLAMSGLASQAFPRIDLDLQTALDYLHGDALRLDSDHKGYVVLTYKNFSLGFAKNIGNRANNLYPAEWRIRKSVR